MLRRKARMMLAKCFQLTEREYKNGASKRMSNCLGEVQKDRKTPRKTMLMLKLCLMSKNPSWGYIQLSEDSDGDEELCSQAYSIYPIVISAIVSTAALLSF